MHLEPHVTQVTDHLSSAAALGDDRTREIAGHLAESVVPAVRLALLGAASDLADEITSVLVDLPGSPTVTVRLEGGDGGRDVVVDVQLADAPDAVNLTADDRTREDGDATARISLRLSETLKTDIDAAAARDGISVNTWLVRAANAALNPNPFESLAAFGKQFAGPGGFGGHGSRGRHGWGGPGGMGGMGGAGGAGGAAGGGQRITGWIDG